MTRLGRFVLVVIVATVLDAVCRIVWPDLPEWSRWVTVFVFVWGLNAAIPLRPSR